MRYRLLLVFFLIHPMLFAQGTLVEIDLYQIPQRKIRKYITNRIKNHVIFFSDLHASWYKNHDPGAYNRHEKTYLVKKKPDIVWSNYLTANPNKSWNGKKVSFGLLLSKYDDKIIYPEDNYDGLDTGQVFFVNVGVLKGINNMAVAFEVIDIDFCNKTIEFSYMEGGKSQGMQRLHFVPTPKGHTRIVHESFYQCRSKLRARVFYPYFHEKIIDDFHQNMREEMKHGPSIKR